MLTCPKSNLYILSYFNSSVALAYKAERYPVEIGVEMTQLSKVIEHSRSSFQRFPKWS